MADEQTSAVATDESRIDAKVTCEDAGPALKRLTIEISESAIAEQMETTYDQLTEEAVIPGFRKGKAPRGLVERRFGSSIKSDVKNQLLATAYQQAIEDEGLDVLSDPEIPGIEELEVPESGPMSFTAEVEVTPDIDLPAFDSLEVAKTQREVTDEDVSEEIENLQRRFGQMTAGGESVEEGDFVWVEASVYEGHGPAEDAEPLQHLPGTYIMVNGEKAEYKGHVAGIVVSDMGKRLLEKKVGDEERIEMTGPASHEDEKVRDQPITIDLKIERIERMQPAPIETLMAQSGATDEDDLRSKVREAAEQRLEREQQQAQHKQILDQLHEKVELDLPEKISGRQAGRLLQRKAMELAYQGVPQEEIQTRVAELREASESESKHQLKQFFLIDKASKDLEIEVSDQELNGRIAMIAMQQGRRPEKLRADMQQRGEIEQLFLQIREQKTLDKILEQAKVTEEEAKD
ncbi:trigger factor [Mucisphaera calidilacus]|uniref:Trigger factor n=1 Tax=Mucisphaera calidilacus TaxID=2527982 RepID=A0A518BV41_9BACT|nr:trigger factor [Mucisphaera calidilacus]QDU70836.1 Trigger factor [Mucisphaera calidilacus]